MSAIRHDGPSPGAALPRSPPLQTRTRATSKDGSSWANADISFVPLVNPANKIRAAQGWEQLREARGRAPLPTGRFWERQAWGRPRATPSVCPPHSAGRWQRLAAAAAWALPSACCVAVCRPVFRVWSPSQLLLPELCFPTPRPARAVTSCDQLSASC